MSEIIHRVERPIGIRNLVPRLPERGKIKIGIKGKTILSRNKREFQPPQKLDHFRITTLERGPDNNFLVDREFDRRFGEHPTEIPIRLLYDDPALNFVTRYACFLGRTLWCSGDGESATRISEEPPKTRDELEALRPQPRTVNCTCFRQAPAYEGRDKCKMNGNLSVIIEGASGLGGVWNFRTTSYNSIVGLMSSMAFIRRITGGVLANIPLLLKIQPKQATSPTDGAQLTIYVVGLEFAGNVEQLQQIGHQIALNQATTQVAIKEIEHEARQRLSLAPPTAPLPGDDDDDVVEEFYPEQVDEPPPPRIEDYEPDPGPEDQPYIVIDNEGESHEYHTARGAEDALQVVVDEADRRGRDAAIVAYENNRALMVELNIEPSPEEPIAPNTMYNPLQEAIAKHGPPGYIKITDPKPAEAVDPEPKRSPRTNGEPGSSSEAKAGATSAGRRDPRGRGPASTARFVPARNSVIADDRFHPDMDDRYILDPDPAPPPDAPRELPPGTPPKPAAPEGPLRPLEVAMPLRRGQPDLSTWWSLFRIKARKIETQADFKKLLDGNVRHLTEYEASLSEEGRVAANAELAALQQALPE